MEKIFYNNVNMKILITGRSGVGKTTILKSLNRDDVYYADDFVKNILYKQEGPVLDFMRKKYPKVVENNEVNTKKLGKILFQSNKKMEEVNQLVAPLVRNWIQSLPHHAIIEMAAYINNQKRYQDLFDKIILIKRKKYSLNEKFAYLTIKKQPIKKKYINANYIIKNNGPIADAVFELNNLLRKKFNKKINEH